MIQIFRRISSLLIIIWLAATVSFFALRILPGDAIEAQLRQNAASPLVIEQRRNEQGLDSPVWIQYVRYMLGLFHGDLGYSLIDGQPVSEMIAAQFFPTFTLAITAIVLASVSGISAGILTVLATNLHLSSALNLIVNLSLSMPIYWTGTVAILIFSIYLRLLPSTGAGLFNQLILPASVLGFQSTGTIARVVKSSLIEVVASDFVRTARAKGLTNPLIVRQHILRVGLLPIITAITIQFGFLMSGTVITESLFVRPGLGRLLLDRTLQQDYPVVQGIVVLTAVVYSILNMLTDVTYRLLDPRIVMA
jgi:ABC-type dipeptide/oligopeptide/nickel transport system permease component